MIQITAVHMAGGEGHGHIADLRWRNLTTGGTGESSRAAVVAWLGAEENRAVVHVGQQQVDVGVVDATPPYLRTHKDGVWTDNLLALPRF